MVAATETATTTPTLSEAERDVYGAWAAAAVHDTNLFVDLYEPKVLHPERQYIPFEPHKYQRKLMRMMDAGGPVVVLKGRQTGISTAVMIQKLRRCQQARTILVVSRKEKLAAELVRIARDAFTRSKFRMPMEITTDNTLELGFSTGGRILAESASPNTGRTYATSDVVLDEFAFLPWQEEMWTSLAPTASRGGNIHVVSTPDMEGDLFEGFWTQAKAGRGWKGLKVHWSDCPEYVPPGTVPEESAWYAETRPKYTVADFAREFGCLFGHAKGAVFAAATIDKAMKLGDAQPTRRGRQAMYTQGADVAGAGRAESVVATIEHAQHPALVVDMRGWDTLPAPELVANFEEAHSTFRHLGGVRRTVEFGIDRGGLGYGIAGHMSTPNVTGVAFTGGREVTGTEDEPNVPRSVLITELVLGLENGDLAIPSEWFELIMGLRSHKWDKERSRFHDWVDALAIAWWLVQRRAGQPGRVATATRRSAF